MPAFTLYGSPGSSNTNRIRLVLAEGGFTDYDLVLLNLPKGEQRTPENIARHPWGKVPSIVFPDGFTLFESRAISRYLAQKYSVPLLPNASDDKSFGLFEQALAVEIAYFADPAGKISFEKHVKKMAGAPADEAVVAQAATALEKFFDVAEKQLLKDGYMAGKDFTLADVYYVPLMQRLVACGYGGLFESRPAVQAWWAKLQERPSFKEVMVPKK